jgi:hypothetical protein
MGHNLDSSRPGIEDEEFLELGDVDGVGEVDRVGDAC